MKRTWFICLLQCLTATFLLSQSNTVPRINSSARVAGSSAVSVVSTAQADPKAQAKILDQYGKLPLSFEANHGQADSQVKFLSRTGGYTLFLTGDEAVLALRGKSSVPAKSVVSGKSSVSGRSFVSGYRFSDTVNVRNRMPL